uniref:Uncharacterized protein n=1 Tax=Sinocyclocheilus rhinocerous TaxID=307959 RepID=A0A673FSU0_9TELE
MAVQETAAQLSMALKVQEYPTLKVCQAFPLHTLNMQLNRSSLRYITVKTNHFTEVIASCRAVTSAVELYIDGSVNERNKSNNISLVHVTLAFRQSCFIRRCFIIPSQGCPLV